jgi:hypothetical protein
MLATTKENFSGFLCRKFHWRKRSVLMTSIAKRLLGAFATGTPEVIFAFLYVDWHWEFLCDNWC